MTKPEIEPRLKHLGYDWTSIPPEDVGKELKKQKAECWSGYISIYVQDY